ncbi:hypothetical protein LPJ53_003911 [Coemansia erecta]|uniref:P-loop containing nucleoside triphosphate hydrolase protein n=1 Tax=Coemansia erecta TaxID=147472 RepID=A0A9W8CPR4_9FUNG|nr:hypothetical protein LPJ53_003911 [Coemansia erecta]
MDGFHLTKAQLAAMSDPAHAMLRRGSPWTFDGRGFAEIVKRIGKQPDSVIWAPSFDHAVGDPVPESIRIEPTHRVVLVEGLYAHVRDEPWSDICNLVDQRWWIQPRNTEQSLERLFQRHVEAGLAADRGAAIKRYETNDKLNSDYADKCRYPPHQVILN